MIQGIPVKNVRATAKILEMEYLTHKTVEGGKYKDWSHIHGELSGSGPCSEVPLRSSTLGFFVISILQMGKRRHREREPSLGLDGGPGRG